MSSLERPSVDDLMRLADELEAAAFRWGSLSALENWNAAEWEEGRVLVHARRLALKHRLVTLWANSLGPEHRTPIVRLAEHYECDLERTVREDIDFCAAHGVYVVRETLRPVS